MTRPKLTGIRIYIDGELSTKHQMSRYAALGARLVGYTVYTGLERLYMASLTPTQKSKLQ
jgi:hypothetical protein